MELEPGHQWEKAVFGRCSLQKRPYRPMSRAPGTKAVMADQVNLNWNPSAPSTKVGQELMECTQSYMSAEDASKLKLYCAIGTVLDFMHNIDGFFMVNNRVLPIDLKWGNPPPQYERGSFLLIQKDCSGMTMWRSCLKIARALELGSADEHIYRIEL